MKILVVYATRSGTCKMLAERIGNEMGADIEQIDDQVNRKGVFGFIRSGYQSKRKSCSPIGPLKKDPADYDLTIVVAPIWAGAFASPVRTLLRDYGKRMKEAALLVTHAGPKGEYRSARDEFEAAYGKHVRAFGSLCIKDGNDRLETEAELFLKELVG